MAEKFVKRAEVQPLLIRRSKHSPKLKRQSHKPFWILKIPHLNWKKNFLHWSSTLLRKSKLTLKTKRERMFFLLSSTMFLTQSWRNTSKRSTEFSRRNLRPQFSSLPRDKSNLNGLRKTRLRRDHSLELLPQFTTLSWMILSSQLPSSQRASDTKLMDPKSSKCYPLLLNQWTWHERKGNGRREDWRYRYRLQEAYHQGIEYWFPPGIAILHHCQEKN